MLLSRSNAMKRWIEGLSRLEDTEDDMDEFAHHGADDDHGRLAGSGEAIPASSYRPRIADAHR